MICGLRQAISCALESVMKKNSQVAIVTGGGSGIGRAVAVGLGARGYRVVLAGRRAGALEETGRAIGQQGVDWVAVSADISVHDDRKHIIEHASRLGRIDAIVNNAALGTCKKLGELSEAEIAALFAVNAIGPIELVRLALPELIRLLGSGSMGVPRRRLMG